MRRLSRVAIKRAHEKDTQDILAALPIMSPCSHCRAHQPEDTPERRLGLVVGFAVSRAPIIGMHGLVCAFIPRAWKGSALIAICSLVAIGLWCVCRMGLP
jgi:hypothetical protein